MELLLDRISFSYSGTDRKIFSGVNFAVKRGEVFCLLGPNGCGKTTLLNCISGLLKVDKGKISVDGDNIYSMEKRKLAQYIGYVPQYHHPTYNYTVREFVVLGRSPYISLFGRPNRHDYQLADEAIEALNINYLRDKSYLQISGGERQLALFARTLTQQPSFILLDEPTASLDFGNQLKIVSLTRQLADMGFAIIMTTHHPDHALSVADYVCIMHEGEIIALGKPEEVMTESILTKIYRTRVIMAHIKSIGRFVCVPVEEKPFSSLKNHCVGG